MSDHRINLDEIQAQLGGHSIFAPSSSARWLACPGSLIPGLLAGDSAGYDAAEGTVAHGVAERWLRTGLRPSELVGTVERVVEATETFEIPITDEMLDYVQEYVDWCEFLPGEHYIETKVDFSDLTPIPNQRGTADHAACSQGLLIVSDLKFGKGVQVFAENNTQALLYAYGFFREWDWLYDFERILIRIGQPRLNHFDEWEVSREYLLEFAESVKPKATLAWTTDAPRVAGEKQCTFCPLKATCPALLLVSAKLTECVFDDLDAHVTEDAVETLRQSLRAGAGATIVSPLDLTSDQIGKALLWRKSVEGWFKAAAEELYRRLDLGEQVEDWKLVEGKSRRSWCDPVAAQEHLEFLGLSEDDIFERSMLTPSKVEKVLVGKKVCKRKSLPVLLNPVVVKTKGAMTMARATDGRVEVETGDPFDDIDGEL